MPPQNWTVEPPAQAPPPPPHSILPPPPSVAPPTPPLAPSPPRRKKWPFIVGGVLVLLAAVVFVLSQGGPPKSDGQPVTTGASTFTNSADLQYLLFQSFYGAYDAATVGLTSDRRDQAAPTPWNQAKLKANLESYVSKMQNKLGVASLTIAPNRRYGFATGPLSIEQGDQDLADSIKTAFDVALEKNVALALHLDISHYWRFAKGADGVLLAKGTGTSDVREWKDWKGTIADGDPWDSIGTLMPSMCFECAPVKAMVDQKTRDVIAPAVKAGIGRLQAAGKQDLFAGIIVGWEAGSMSTYAYHSLSLKGKGPSTSKADLNLAQQQILHDYLERWAKGLNDAGVPKENIYTHISGIAEWHSDQSNLWWESFNPYSRAGFSIYANSSHEFDSVWAQAKKQNAPWAEVEGTNAMITGKPSPINWETYLGHIFNHGGTLANIFAGFLPQPAGSYTASTEGAEAVAAYKKFLRGETLVETAPAGGESLGDKVQRAQREFQAWGPTHKSQAPAVQKLFEELTAEMQANDMTAAEKTVDKILAIIKGT